jgi:hypothetical protein
MDNFFDVLFITYYTKQEPFNYQKVFEQYLKPSLLKFNLPYYALAIDNIGKHNDNANYKPSFIQHCMKKFKDTVNAFVFLDADAEVLEKPTLFYELKEDIGIHYLDRKSWYNEKKECFDLLPGTFYLKNNANVKFMIEEWIYMCKKNKDKWDNQILKDVLPKCQSLTINRLPLNYCYIRTLPNGKEPNIKVDKPVIVHNQVSRKFRC